MEQQGLFVGLIPDGNRRAVDYDVTRYADTYERGSEVVGDILRACVEDSRIKIFAAWGSSDDNMRKRSGVEQRILNTVFHQYLDRLETTLEEYAYRGVKVVHMGNPEFLDREVHGRLCDMAHHTRDRQEKLFALCLGYGSHDEMDRAVHISHAHQQEDWENFLDLPHRGKVPYQPLDLIVRTGTDPLTPYTSGWLLPYQDSGTQMRFVAQYLPEFSAAGFMDIVDEATDRHMRRGA